MLKMLIYLRMSQNLHTFAHRITNEIKTSQIMNCNYKINYRKQFDNENGTVYCQCINVEMRQAELTWFNNIVGRARMQQPNPMYNAKELHEGINYCNLTTSRLFAERFGMSEDKRYKTDRNTMIKIKVVKTF